MLQKRSVILTKHTRIFFLVAKARMLFVGKKMMKFRADHLLQEKALLRCIAIFLSCGKHCLKSAISINQIFIMHAI